MNKKELINFIWQLEIEQGFYENDHDHLTIENIDYISNVPDGIRIHFKDQIKYMNMTFNINYYNKYKTIYLREKKLNRIIKKI